VGKFAASTKRPKAKSVSAPGGLCSMTPRPVALPMHPVGDYYFIRLWTTEGQ